MLNRFIILAAACLTLPSAGLAVFTNQIIIFEENFADHPQNRFTLTPMSPPGTTITSTETHYKKNDHTYSLKGYGAVIRQASAGPVAELELSLLFPPAITNLQTEVDVAFLFGLMDQSAAGIQILRTASTKSTTRLRFIEMRSGQEQPTILREFALTATKLAGKWQLLYRHGMLCARKDAKELGYASIQRIGVPIAGMTWLQRGGEVSCDHLSLRGEPVRELSANDRAVRARAASLNQEARQFLNQTNFAEALLRMSNSSALYVQVHGENHPDSVNSFVNLALILSKAGQPKPAALLFAKALAIHEMILGPNHPHTTMTRFQLGELCFNQGEIAAAKKHWTRCRDDWRIVFGPDYPLVKSLDATLLRL